MWDEYMYAASEMAATYAGFDFSESLVRHVRLRIVTHVLEWCARVRARLGKCRKVSGDLIDPKTYRIAPEVAADTCVVVAARMARYVHARTGTPLADEVQRVRREVVEVAMEVLEAVARVGRYAGRADKGEEEQVLVRKAVFEVMTKAKMEVPRYVQQGGGVDGKAAWIGKRGKVKMADPDMYAGLVEKMQDMLFGSA
ncbi:hypothetical protein BCR44DRAFT_1437556 [Catenaria anguillulae PL171]|uniref:Uncharacterized protein n=1 Tax=Catenaria anguillulae PL171 TaxID=765915 RepID=A0A1Y2HIF4_9FUNG|nr:hypothetical protein BCR44DRAFT_1437556 [Catenaria anguillulae PL171]